MFVCKLGNRRSTPSCQGNRVCSSLKAQNRVVEGIEFPSTRVVAAFMAIII
eukprot:m.6339 g.6339  ORF g.6339 m.6339 type:complete len:51 (+) comp8400_c0_seq1:487-639(+)